MFRKLFSTILLFAICSAVPIFDSRLAKDDSEVKNIRVKRYDFFGGYNPYMNHSPYSYKIKTPFFKVKIKNRNENGFFGNPLMGFGNTGGFYPPYGAGAFHPPIHSPYGYNYNPHGYGWFG
ncbi:High osmolarity signaling protein [Dirofilaria immitis]